MLATGKLLNAEGGYETLRTPGYPLVLAMMIGLFREAYYIGVILLQIAVNVIAIYFLYKFCTLVSNRNSVALLAAGAAALNFLDIRYTCSILTDSLAQSFLLISLFFFAKYLRNSLDESGCRSLTAGAGFLLLTALLRPAFVFLTLAMLAGILFVLIVQRQYERVLAAALIMCVAILPLAGWWARNITMAGYNGYSSIGSVNLYQYSAAPVYAKQRGLHVYEAREILQKGLDEGLKPYLETMPLYEAYNARGLEIIKSDIPAHLKACLFGVACIFLYPGLNDMLHLIPETSGMLAEVKAEMIAKKNLAAGVAILFSKPLTLTVLLFLGMDVLLLLLLLIFAAAGAFRLSDWRVNLMLLGVIAYFVVIACQPNGYGTYPRFRLSISMLLALYASMGADSFARRFFGRGQKITGTSHTTAAG